MLECWDRKNKDYVAIKIVRNVQKYRDAAMIEVHSLSCLGASSILCSSDVRLKAPWTSSHLFMINQALHA